MRIGICCFPSFGGSGVVASELALALAEGGDSVHVVSSTRPSRREAFGRHACHWARSHFDRGAIVARYREVYRATLTPGGASAPRPGEAIEGNVDA